MLAGLIIVPAVSLVTSEPPRSLVDAAFASYEKKVTVYQREALSDDAEQVE